MNDRFVVFSDTHVHPYKRFATIGKDGTNTRVRIILDAINTVHSYCFDKGIKKVIFLGDLFHTRRIIQADVFNDTFEAMMNFIYSGMELWMVLGNHDMITEGSKCRHLYEIFSREAHVISNFKHEEEISSVFIPYNDTSECNTLKDIEADFVFGHVGLSSVGYGDVSVNVFEGKKLVLLGHYHERMSVNKCVHYVGSLVPHDFNDSDQDRGFYDVSVSGKDINLEFVPIKSPKFITIQFENLPKMDKDKLVGNYVRVIGKSSEIDAGIRDSFIESGSLGVVFNTIEDKAKESRLFNSLDLNPYKMVEVYVNKFREEGSLEGKNSDILIAKGKSILEECRN